MQHLRQVIVSVVILAGGLPGAQLRAADRAADWWARAAVYQTKYYAVKSDLAPADARALGAHMDATFESYMLLFSKLPIQLRRPARLALYLFADQEDYLVVSAVRFGADAAGSGAQCITRGQQIAITTFRGDKSIESMKSSLQHEGFHQVARHFFPRLPPWADEGLAVLFGRGVMVGRTLALGEFTGATRPDWWQPSREITCGLSTSSLASRAKSGAKKSASGPRATTIWRPGAWSTIASSPRTANTNPASWPFSCNSIAASTGGPRSSMPSARPISAPWSGGGRITCKTRLRPTIGRRCGDWSFWPPE